MAPLKPVVVSTTLNEVDWNAQLVDGDVGEAVRQLKEEWLTLAGRRRRYAPLYGGLIIGGVLLALLGSRIDRSGTSWPP